MTFLRQRGRTTTATFNPHCLPTPQSHTRTHTHTHKGLQEALINRCAHKPGARDALNKGLQRIPLPWKHTHTINTREDEAVWKVGLQQLTHLVLTLTFDIAITSTRLSLSRELSVRTRVDAGRYESLQKWRALMSEASSHSEREKDGGRGPEREFCVVKCWPGSAGTRGLEFFHFLDLWLR